MPLLDCQHHDDGVRPRVCPHLMADRTRPHFRRFTGQGIDYDLVCEACIEAVERRTLCAACLHAIEENSDNHGFRGQPEIRTRPGSFRFRHRTVSIPLPAEVADVQPIAEEDRPRWVALAGRGLFLLDLDDGAATLLARLPADAPAVDALHLSADGLLAALVERCGQSGLVLDLKTGRTTMALDRGLYQIEHCNFPVAFATVEGRLLLVHGTDWNRLDVSDPRTGQRLTDRPVPEHGGEHSLDYFHCGLSVSPDGEHIAEDGWVWHPVGEVVAWNLRRWLRDNAWESEDGASRRLLCWRDYFWDGPLCWLDSRRLAVWGQGEDSNDLIPAVRIFDVTTGKEERWFAGPVGESLFFDDVLFSCHAEQGTAVWDAESGERLLHDPDVRPTRYHRAAKTLLTTFPGGTFRLSKLVGWPVDPSWRTEAVLRVAEGIAAEGTFADLPVLADALEEAGCTDPALLVHCRESGAHGHECWVLDRILDGEPR